MPNGHDLNKRYGKHDYGEFERGIHPCKHGCGCFMTRSSSGGPVGLDPFGECPNNPVDGKRLGEQADYRLIVERRIHRGEGAQALLARMRKSKLKLAADLALAEHRLGELENWALNLQNKLRESFERRPGRQAS